MINAGDRVVILRGARYGGQGFTRGLRVPPYLFNQIVEVSSVNDSGDAYIGSIHSWIPIEHLREIPRMQPAEPTIFKTHGMSGSRLYRIYNAMKQRCYNPKAINYSCYGGKGITICDEWRQGFEPFYEWAISHGYEDDLEIDRIDPDKNYCPENCRWLSKAENVCRANRRRKGAVKTRNEKKEKQT